MCRICIGIVSPEKIQKGGLDGSTCCLIIFTYHSALIVLLQTTNLPMHSNWYQTERPFLAQRMRCSWFHVSTSLHLNWALDLSVFFVCKLLFVLQWFRFWFNEMLCDSLMEVISHSVPVFRLEVSRDCPRPSVLEPVKCKNQTLVLITHLS